MDKNFYFTWAINVRRNIIRKNIITKQLKNNGVNFKIFEAITPFSKVEFKHYYNPRRTEIYYGRPLMETELACALSHVSLWKKLINQDKYKHFLIFEDDVVDYLAQQAIELKLGARGLRSIIESIMLDAMYDINYDSCTLQAPLVDGIYSGEMEVTNDIDTVVVVVWFKDSEIEPVYKEFSLEVGAQVARRGTGAQTLVWR